MDLRKLGRPRNPRRSRVDVIVRVRAPKQLTAAGWDTVTRSMTLMPDNDPPEREMITFVEALLDKIAESTGLTRS